MERIPSAPPLSKPSNLYAKGGVENYLSSLYGTLFTLFARIGVRLNGVLPKDGTEAMTAPLQHKASTVAELTSLWPAASYTGAILYCSNETGGATLVFSDGTNWRRVQDRAVAS